MEGSDLNRCVLGSLTTCILQLVSSFLSQPIVYLYAQLDLSPLALVVVSLRVRIVCEDPGKNWTTFQSDELWSWDAG